MSFDYAILIFIAMLMLHFFEDFVLQHLSHLCDYKQKSWWKENAPDKMYKNDYKYCLIAHSFCWSTIVMLPVIIGYFYTNHNLLYRLFMILIFITNVAGHFVIDDAKANKRNINLIQDQLCHISMIFATWVIFYSLIEVIL